MTSLWSPLEQFEIAPLIPIRLGVFDFSITNSAFFGFVVFGFLTLLFHSVTLNKKGTIIPGRWQFIVENLYQAALSLVYDNVGVQGKKYFPLIFTLLSFLLMANLVGMVPYGFTVTSHLIVTFGLALLLFIGINIICIRAHKEKFLCLFLPSGSSLALVPLLVPIELVSYIFRVISLPVRLFANMMAGHTLLKVIAGFAWSMMSSGGILFVAHFIPLFLLVLLIGLEFGVAIVQAYVFTILTCMYLNDAIHLH